MIRNQGVVRWGILAAALAGLTALYAPSLSTGFLNDDFLFIEDASRPGWWEALTRLGPLTNYYRPVSRPLYFRLLLPLFGVNPLAFHLFNYALFLVALVLVADLLRAFLPRTGVLVGLLYFALLPFQRVNLVWVSCSQDLLALVFTLAAIACFRRGRIAPAAIAYLLAVFSKESALPLPLLLLLLRPMSGAVQASGPTSGPSSRESARRLLPFAAVGLLWAVVVAMVRSRGAAAELRFDVTSFVAAYAHQVQSLLGLDQPEGMIESLRRHGPNPVALVALVPAALLFIPAGGPGAERAADPRPEGAPTKAWGLGCAWVALFGFVVGPVASSWSSYYYTLAAVGGALIVGHLLRRIGPAGWLALGGALLWWNAGAAGSRAFSVDRDPWQWTSHLTPFYFQRAAALSDTLGRQLKKLEPAPPHHTRFFFAMFPPWAGFQMGNGAQVRILYRDSTLESHFYSQFSESTAAGYPCRFLYWDGERMAPLYGPRNVFFLVGSDQMVFGRYASARHAFRRAIEAGEYSGDLLYWLGWTELWLGHRAAAEAAWTRMGAVDDSSRWRIRMRLARMALIDRRDTVEARRQLVEAIRSGIGRPEAHAVLGPLLLQERPKYGLLELKVAASLRPNDWLARRDLILGLVDQRLDESARAELAALQPIYPGWEHDSLLIMARSQLERRGSDERAVARF